MALVCIVLRDIGFFTGVCFLSVLFLREISFFTGASEHIDLASLAASLLSLLLTSFTGTSEQIDLVSLATRVASALLLRDISELLPRDINFLSGASEQVDLASLAICIAELIGFGSPAPTVDDGSSAARRASSLLCDVCMSWPVNVDSWPPRFVLGFINKNSADFDLNMPAIAKIILRFCKTMKPFPY